MSRRRMENEYDSIIIIMSYQKESICHAQEDLTSDFRLCGEPDMIEA